MSLRALSLVNMAAKTFGLELFPDCRVTLALFTEVQNCRELKRSIVDGDIDGALLNASMIVDPFQVLVAANKAIHLNHHGKMKTRNINSEVLFNLSPTNNISDAFKKFGLGDDDTAFLAAILNDNNGDKLESLEQQVDGNMVGLDQLKITTDQAKIQKIYKIQDLELKNSTLVDAVVCRMASKDAT
ncbi:EKC/KEOPS complex subunit Tprkb-like [Ptychodera flava]|uniref:EKC/KEOPS complex subunit Tprkb-like n=1 Tax=Ptychodera flava TaxID=63121 RepID=UPI00396A839D